MPDSINHGRYVCDTCKTIFNSGLIPIITKQPKLKDGQPRGIMTVDEAIILRRIVLECTDPYWRGHQGITTNNFLDGVKEYILWRTKHKCHRVRTLRHKDPSPVGYSTEKYV